MKRRENTEEIEQPVVPAVVETFTPPAPVKRTVEAWAAEKGYTPHMDGSRENPRYWVYAAARALSRWPVGAEATEAEFDAALNDAASVEIKS